MKVNVSTAHELVNGEKVEGYLLYYHTAPNQTHNEFRKKEDFPFEIDSNTVLRYKNGDLIIDEELTQEKTKRMQELEKSTKELVRQYKTDGVEYEVLAVEHLDTDPSIRLKNTVTGLDFSTNDFYKEEFYKLQEGMILQCKNGEYILPN